MLAAAPLALAALPAAAHALPAVAEPAPIALDTPAGWSEPSPLVSDLIGAHIRSASAAIDDVHAGLAESEVRARLLERGRAIHADLAAPHGEAGDVAWRESLDRFAYGFELIVATVNATGTA